MWAGGWAQVCGSRPSARGREGTGHTPRELWAPAPGTWAGPSCGPAGPGAIRHNYLEQEWPWGQDRFPRALEPERPGSRIWVGELGLIRDYESLNSLPGPLKAGNWPPHRPHAKGPCPLPVQGSPPVTGPHVGPGPWRGQAVSNPGLGDLGLHGGGSDDTLQD